VIIYDDYIHFIGHANSGGIYYHRGTPAGAGTSYSWSAATTVDGDGRAQFPTHAVQKVGTDWYVHYTGGFWDGATASARYARVKITSAGAISIDAAVSSIATGGDSSIRTTLAIDAAGTKLGLFRTTANIGS
jgi:hypothetical protein